MWKKSVFWIIWRQNIAMMSLNTRLLRLEEASIGGKQRRGIGLMERMKIYEQIYEGTANPDDPQVQECMKNTRRYKKYFAELDGQQPQDVSNEST
jgi:hypothetical protein